MSVEDNKAIVSRCIEEAFNRHNVAALDEFLAPNVDHHSLPPGVPRDREGFKQFVGMLLTAFPDLRITIEDMVAEGDRVVARATTSGTQSGGFMGMPPTGKQATWTEMFIWRIDGRKAVEMWAELDRMGMMQQLGVIGMPGQGG